MNTKAWLHGLAGAAIGAIGSSVSVMIVDPTTFNFTPAGWLKLGEISLVSAVLAAALYLKQSPLPNDAPMAQK